MPTTNLAGSRGGLECPKNAIRVEFFDTTFSFIFGKLLGKISENFPKNKFHNGIPVMDFWENLFGKTFIKKNISTSSF